jgi:hypothetical protein
MLMKHSGTRSHLPEGLVFVLRCGNTAGETARVPHRVCNTRSTRAEASPGPFPVSLRAVAFGPQATKGGSPRPSRRSGGGRDPDSASSPFWASPLFFAKNR